MGKGHRDTGIIIAIELLPLLLEAMRELLKIIKSNATKEEKAQSIKLVEEKLEKAELKISTTYHV